MGGDKRKKRPFEEPSEQILINLRIKSQDGTVLYYTVKPTSSMKTLFKSYAKKKQIMDYKTIRFLYNGERLSSRKTVNQDGTTVHFKVKDSIVMKDIFNSYTRKKQMIDYRIFRFFIHGKRLSSRKTVNEDRP
ncbi:small ubiquitin-related modifier 5 isoform X1 [Capsicum annuum]|uniref:small ubiquitin-related modifier 5 isoform X1 n=1 Tax=Capsicum annuum TaxID=4072 RepID=UPI0007BF77C8|nr:small ubiquitin-related modifier 5 isoform X1 [Capsicum annuum]